MPEASRVPSRLSGGQPRRQLPTNADLEKKRQTDRASQRVVRERMKNYISHLESLVDTLQKSQQDERLQNMTFQCKQLYQENERLRNVITGISRMVRGVEISDSGKDLTPLQPATSAESVAIQKQPITSLANKNDFISTHPLQNEQPQPQSPLWVEEQTLAPKAFMACTGSSCSKPRSSIEVSETFAFDSEACLLNLLVHVPQLTPQMPRMGFLLMEMRMYTLLPW
jgi:hypothetical protein